MFLLAALSAVLPTGYGMIVGETSGIAGQLGLVGVLLVIMFLGSLGFGALLQSSNCDGVKDMKRVAADAGIATGIMSGFLLVPVLKVPWLHNMISTSDYGTDTGAAGTTGAAGAGAALPYVPMTPTAPYGKERRQKGGALPTTDTAVGVPIDMGFWAFWGALYGFAVGGTLAATC